jgi:hypothetical protein
MSNLKLQSKDPTDIQGKFEYKFGWGHSSADLTGTVIVCALHDEEAHALARTESERRLSGSPTTTARPDVSNAQSMPRPAPEQDQPSPKTWIYFSKEWWVDRNNGNVYGYWTSDRNLLCNAAIPLGFYEPARVVTYPWAAGACPADAILHGTAIYSIQVN